MRKGQVLVALQVQEHDLLARDTDMNMRRQEVRGAHHGPKRSYARMSFFFKDKGVILLARSPRGMGRIDIDQYGNPPRAEVGTSTGDGSEVMAGDAFEGHH